MKKYSTILITIALALSFISTAAIAQPFGGGMLGGGRGMRGQALGGMQGGALNIRGLMNLDLTEAQREQIRLIMDENREIMLADCDATYNEMTAIRDELNALMDAPVFDEAAAQRLLTQKFNINTEKQILRMKAHHRILNEVLTEEQRETLANQWANSAAFGRGAGRGAGMGAPGRMNRGINRF
jgi:protein CpxP